MNFFMILSCKISFLDVFVAKVSSTVKKKFNHFGLTWEEKKKEHYAGQGSIDKIFHDKRISLMKVWKVLYRQERFCNIHVSSNATKKFYYASRNMFYELP